MAAKRINFNYDSLGRCTYLDRYASTDQSEFVASSRYSHDNLNRPLKELAEFARPHFKGREAEALANLTAVDGSVFAVLPRMACRCSTRRDTNQSTEWLAAS
ncbi:hypothetical protein [Anatilimnocola floriformis]|uniref:hypothetical protein n=1 Tax=Anatilimnocola floriformis TaxID=2948575 RepID=UPI0020C1E968|nr:hypothetical protein [Anatilimnocola floriformis]